MKEVTDIGATVGSTKSIKTRYNEFYKYNDIEGMIITSESQIKSYVDIASEKNYSWTN